MVTVQLKSLPVLRTQRTHEESRQRGQQLYQIVFVSFNNSYVVFAINCVVMMSGYK